MDTTERDLQTPGATCVYIPPSRRSRDLPIHGSSSKETNSLRSIHVEGALEAQFSAYRAAWTKCLERVQSVLKTLQATITEEVSTYVKKAQTDVLPGLPYPELPVVALSGASHSLLADIVEQLDQESDDADACRVVQIHLHPADCNTLVNTMKAIISGFIDQDPEGSNNSKRRTTTSLANYDINLLRAWYDSLGDRPNLTVFMHEFEKFDSNVMQDVFEIFSHHVPYVSLVFVLLLSSPSEPSYLHTAYPRDTLALLRVQEFSTFTTKSLICDVLVRTFFEPDFEPPLMLGPAAMEYIADFASRHTPSLDALVTILQLIHMKHFSTPMTTIERYLAPSQAQSVPLDLLKELRIRLLAASNRPQTNETGWQALNADALLKTVSDARSKFKAHAQRIRVAYNAACITERVVLGPTHIAGKERDRRLGTLEALGDVLRGRVSTQIKYVCLAVRKLSSKGLRALLSDLHAFYHNLGSAALRREEEEARFKIITATQKLPDAQQDEEEEGPRGPEIQELAGGFGEWLQTYLLERLESRLDDGALWDAWYTGATPFPAELINPAPRATVVAALLHPHEFARAHATLARAPAGGDVSGDVPDTSVLLKGYLEAGRTINVYDWYQAFAGTLDGRRRQARRRTRRAAPPPTPSSHRRSGKGKGRMSGGEAAMEVDVDTEDDDAEAEEDEAVDDAAEDRWRVEVQARFIRALHELDYMGFVKHTGRKADHVVRTVFDVPE